MSFQDKRVRTLVDDTTGALGYKNERTGLDVPVIAADTITAPLLNRLRWVKSTGDPRKAAIGDRIDVIAPPGKIATNIQATQNKSSTGGSASATVTGFTATPYFLQAADIPPLGADWPMAVSGNTSQEMTDFGSLANPAVEPDAPTIGTAVAGNNSITLNWTAPANNGGSAFTQIEYRLSNGNTGTATLGSTSVTVPAPNGIPVSGQVRYRNSIGPGNYSALSNSVTPIVAPPDILRVVSQNNGINSGLVSAAGMDLLYAAGEGYIGSGAVKSITPRAVGAWYVNGTSNTVVDAPQGCTLVGMVLEDAARTRTVRVTFSGAQSKAIAAGEVNIVADAILAAQLEPSLTELPQGYHFWWKAIWQVPAKGNQICGDSNSYVTPSGQRFWRASDDAANIISSLDTPGYFTATSGSLPGSTGTNFIPQVVFTGVYSAGDAPVWGGIGDSINAGVGDTGPVTAFGPGYFRRALRGTGAVNTTLSGMCIAVGGMKLSTWLGSTKVTQWLQYVNRADCEMATNDFGNNNSFPAASMTALDNQLYDLLGAYNIPASKIIKQDLLPNTTGAFVNADGSDQTIVNGWGAGQVVNTYRATLAATVGVKVAALITNAVARNSTDDNKWVAANTSDGKHPNTSTVTPKAAATRTAMLTVA